MFVGASWREQTDRDFCFMCVRFVCVCIANKLFSTLFYTPTNHVIARAGFILRRPPALWEFCNIFLPNADETKKNLTI